MRTSIENKTIVLDLAILGSMGINGTLPALTNLLALNIRLLHRLHDWRLLFWNRGSLH
jgi:hypothetical protein